MAEKKSRKGLITLIIILAVIVIAALFVFLTIHKKNSGKVLDGTWRGDAFTLTIDSGDKTFDIEFTSGDTGSQSGTISVEPLTKGLGNMFDMKAYDAVLKSNDNEIKFRFVLNEDYDEMTFTELESMAGGFLSKTDD